MKLNYTLAALAISAIAAQAAPIFSENFDGLITGISLSGQGGWGGPTGPKVVEDPGSGVAYYGFSGNLVEYSGDDNQENHPLSGLNDTEAVTMEMDLRIHGDGSYTHWILGQSGVSLGVEYGNLALRGAHGGVRNYDHNLSGDKSYHLSMTILPTAFGGAGSATVTLAEWTDESTLGPKTTVFSNAQLDLNVPGKALSANTNTVLRLHGTGNPARADNLNLTQGASALVEMTAASRQVFNNNGTDQTFPIAFANIGSDLADPLDITGVSLSGWDADLFTIPTVWTAAVAANGGSGTIDLPFAPAGTPAGTYYVTLEVTSDAASSPVTINVEVIVDDPIAVVSPMVLNFGDISANPGPQSLTVNIANTGGATALNIFGIDVFDESSVGSFTVGSFPASLAPGANVDVTITFDPGSNQGLFSGNLEISTDGSTQNWFRLPLSAKVSTVTVPVFTENFDALTTGNSLSGQGGWGGPTSVKVLADPGSFGFSGNIAENSSLDNQETHPLSGLNDVGLLTMEFDLRIKGDLSYTYWILGQSGISLGVEYGNLTLRGAFGGTQNFDHNLTGDNVYHMVMTVDPTAFGGAGAATITYAKYTAESTLETVQTAFNNVQLTLNGVGKKLSQNTNFVLRLHKKDAAAPAARADNLSIVQVPEPTVPGGYTNWALAHPGLSDANPSLDFDNDGLMTGIEWLVGSDPTTNDAVTVAPTFDPVSDPNKLLYTYRRSHEADADSNTTIMVEYGSDLIGWRNTIDHGAADGVTATEAFDIEPGIDAVTVAIPKTLGAPTGKLFVRLRVTITP